MAQLLTEVLPRVENGATPETQEYEILYGRQALIEFHGSSI
jgi:hypothetical protein